MVLRCTGALPIHGKAPAKAGLYRDRFELLAQKLARHPHFSKPAFETETSNFGCCEVFSFIIFRVLLHEII